MCSGYLCKRRLCRSALIIGRTLDMVQDRVKYVGSHSVIGRVQLNKVLNPSVAASRETYLRAEVTELFDNDTTEETEVAEEQVKTLFCELVDMQGSLGEEPRFTEAVKTTLKFGVGSGTDDKGLWGTIQLWQQFLEQRAQVIGSK